MNNHNAVFAVTSVAMSPHDSRGVQLSTTCSYSSAVQRAEHSQVIGETKHKPITARGWFQKERRQGFGVAIVSFALWAPEGKWVAR